MEENPNPGRSEGDNEVDADIEEIKYPPTEGEFGSVFEAQTKVIEDGIKKAFSIEGKMETNTSEFLRELEEAQAKDTWQGDVDELRGK